MRRFYPASLIIILTGFVLFIYACSAGTCFDETESQVNATFYSMTTGQTLIPDSVTLYGVNKDTNLIYNKARSLKAAEFPLFAAQDSCKFVIEINGITDTIRFTYNSYTHLLSKECGYTYYYTIDSTYHSSNIIDSISVIKKNITTLNEENMRIYY